MGLFNYGWTALVVYKSERLALLLPEHAEHTEHTERTEQG